MTMDVDLFAYGAFGFFVGFGFGWHALLRIMKRNVRIRRLIRQAEHLAAAKR